MPLNQYILHLLSKSKNDRQAAFAITLLSSSLFTSRREGEGIDFNFSVHIFIPRRERGEKSERRLIVPLKQGTNVQRLFLMMKNE